jgi:hypothetical protein
MDWQIGIVLLLVTTAAAYLGRQTWRTWAGAKGQCGGGCGCGSRSRAPHETTFIAADQLRLRPPNPPTR